MERGWMIGFVALISMPAIAASSESWTSPLVVALLGLLVCLLLWKWWQLTRALKQLQQQPNSALYDELTGLPNARFGQLRLTQLQQQPSRGALLLFQLDQFEQINRVLGYQHANVVLSQAAIRLNQLLLAYPAVFELEAGRKLIHVGGVEFACLVDLTSQDYLAENLLSQLLKQNQEPLLVHGAVIQLTVSAGYARYPEHAAEFNQLVLQARTALFQRRWYQHDSFQFDASMHEFSQHRLNLMAELKQALAEQQLQLDIQPQIHLQTGKVVAGEVLLRWQHPTLGLLAPKAFVPVAEQLGILYPLTCWVIEQALDTLSTLTGEYSDVSIAVNIASSDLMHDELVEVIEAGLQRRGLAGHRLLLEFKEEALLKEPQQAISILRRLADSGIRLALDDFGAGYTSLGLLREMPLEQIKVDCQFVSQLHRSDAQAAITGAIIDMAKNLQWQVVAEGIEEQAVAEKLARMGCQFGQGFFISRPFALQGFLPWLTQHRHQQTVGSE